MELRKVLKDWEARSVLVTFSWQQIRTWGYGMRRRDIIRVGLVLISCYDCWLWNLLTLWWVGQIPVQKLWPVWMYYYFDSIDFRLATTLDPNLTLPTSLPLPISLPLLSQSTQHYVSLLLFCLSQLQIVCPAQSKLNLFSIIYHGGLFCHNKLQTEIFSVNLLIDLHWGREWGEGGRCEGRIRNESREA